MPLTCTPAESEIAVLFDESNVAMSDDPLGGPPAVQFAAVFQSPVRGALFHDALPAKAVLHSVTNISSTAGRTKTLRPTHDLGEET